MITICLYLQGISIKIKKDQLKYAAIFCLGQNSGAFLSFTSVELLPLGAVACCMCGSMMVFGLLLGLVILKERIQLLHVASMLISLAGLAVLVIGSYTSLHGTELNVVSLQTDGQCS